MEDSRVPPAWFSGCPEDYESVCMHEKPLQFSNDLQSAFNIYPTPSSYGKKIIALKISTI